MRTITDILKNTAAKAAWVAVLAVVFVISMPAKANNIRLLGRPVVEHKDTVKHTVEIRFDVAWENSWKAARPNNWDAAWIFIKVWDGGSWNHAYLCDADTTFVAGSTDTTKSVSGAKYKVADKSGRLQAEMQLDPAYSVGYPHWYSFWDEWLTLNGTETYVGPDTSAQKLCVGFFLHRKVNGAGDIVVPGVQVTWQYGNQLFTDEDEFTVKVFVVEMVYVPQGAFCIGGKGTKEYQYGSFTYFNDKFGYPYRITSEVGIPVENDNGDSTLWALDNALLGGRIPEEFPKGHKAFYIMKYELSQQGWCDFLNSISAEQRATRMDAEMQKLVVGHHTVGEVGGVNQLTNKDGLRHYVKVKDLEPDYLFGCDATGGSGTQGKIDEIDWTDWVHADDSSIEWMSRNIDGQDVAMYMVSPRDLFAYAEFACLRPMTEFEYEKACRGSLQPQNDEYAWGDNKAEFFGKAYMQGSISGTGTFTGYINDFANGDENVGKDFNCGYTRLLTNDGKSIPAPLRVGCLADSTTSRHEAGASYWGVMNLSDNVAEICISAYSHWGRRFQGVHGAGQIELRTGEAVQAGWGIPSLDVEKDSGYLCNQFVIERGMCFQYTNGAPVDKDAFWYNSDANNNEVWAKYAGMVSARYRVQAGTDKNAGQLLSTRSIMGASTATGATSPIMRGIRCVRTANAQK